MLVLSGKKIRYFVLGMFAIFMIISVSLSIKDNNTEYIDTVSLPVSGRVVVVDAGHGVPDERCRSR